MLGPGYAVLAAQTADGRNQRETPAVGARSAIKIMAPALCFLAVILALNAAIFRTPYFEEGDFAANALQIQNAKAFRELLGNYSRWHFHHPGPAWFYLWAGGEYLFHDLLHLVPAPINAQILTIIIVNLTFLFGALVIFLSYAEVAAFLPLGLAAADLMIYIVNTTASHAAAIHGALLSIWMPDVLLFCFLFFATACASVASGRIAHLPLMTLSGLMLVHGHVVQILFVNVLAAAALATLLRRRLACETFRQFLRANRRALVVSVLLVMVFAFPVLLELWADKPNNLQRFLEYMRLHRGQRNTLGVSLKYCLSFLIGIGHPEEAVHGPLRQFLRALLSRPDIKVFWSASLAAVVGVAAAWRRRAFAIPFFFRYMAFQIPLIGLLFCYWALRITGPMYSFNGGFIYSLQIVFLWLLLALLARFVGGHPSPVAVTLAACGACLLMLISPAPFRNNYFGNPQVALIASRLPRGLKVRMIYPARWWPLATGVASVMKRGGGEFCADPQWDFMLGEKYVCSDPLKFNRIEFENYPQPCQDPCQVVYEDGQVQVDFLPIARDPE